MYLGTDGVIVNELGQVLLVLRRDIPFWVIPGGLLQAGESPAETVVRAVASETGLQTVAVRLVGMYHVRDWSQERLTFVFRCLQRGGTLEPAAEALQAAFYDPRRLPQPLSPLHRERLDRAVSHPGGPPFWGEQWLPFSFRLYQRAVRSLRTLQQKLRRQPGSAPPPDWQAYGLVVLRDNQGRFLWVRDEPSGRWQLPMAAHQSGETPWRTAARAVERATGMSVGLTGICSVYMELDQGKIFFCFTGMDEGRSSANAVDENGRYVAAGEVPEDSLPEHRRFVADAADYTGHQPPRFEVL